MVDIKRCFANNMTKVCFQMGNKLGFKPTILKEDLKL